MHFKRTSQVLPLVIGLGLGLTGCTVERTRTAKAPDVDLQVEPGRWPQFDVNWADVDVGTTTKTITVPKLEWTREQAQIQVPYIDIHPPGATEREERTVTVELEVPGPGYDLEIREIRAAASQLWVISELKKTGQTGAGVSRVSDQVVINAPQDLTIRKVIIGERPEGVFNRQYSFYSDMSALERRLPGGGRVIYTKNA